MKQRTVWKKESIEELKKIEGARERARERERGVYVEPYRPSCRQAASPLSSQ